MAKKKKKRKIPKHSFRKLNVGSLKGRARKLSKGIVNGEIPKDEEVLYNAIKDCLTAAYCFGWEQRVMEASEFRDKRKAEEDREYNLLLEEIDDIVNLNK